MISSHDVARAEFIIDNSDAVTVLITGYRTSTRGRKAVPNNLRLMLLGLLLSIQHRGKATLSSAYAMLTESIPLDVQERLGIISWTDGAARPDVLITIFDFYNLERSITDRLAYAETSAPDINDAERSRRHDAIRAYCNGLMDVFQVGWISTVAAMDATGIWSWGRGYSTKASKATTAEDANNDTDNSFEPAEPRAPVANGVDDEPADCTDSTHGTTTTVPDSGQPVAKPKRRNPDARWGIKTSKDGTDERFFGYDEHTLVQVPAVDTPKDDEPRLIERFELTPASTDVVDVSLTLLDTALRPIADLNVDRHYHYKDVERWKIPLNQRGIRQHHDLRGDEHGFTEYDRMRWAAGWAHCPGTPDKFATVLRPGPTEPASATASFRVEITKREAWAMRRVDTPNVDGTHRVQCPALAGKLGCPLRDGTEAAAMIYGLARVENPPDPVLDGEPLPKCCTQQTVRTTPPPSVLKLQQPHYWGRQKWETMYTKRTYVEGSYGNRKNISTENLRRGLFQVFGLTWAHVIMGLVNASYNLRMLENWYKRSPRTDLDDHPLLAQAIAPPLGFVTLTAADYLAFRKGQTAA